MSTLLELKNKLSEWVTAHATNGIKQHDKEWYTARVNTISGSILASLMGQNPYKDVSALISEKIGITVFKGDLKTRWGNLFEEVLREYVEYDKQCKVLGDNLYIEGPKYTSYSPDGLAVVEVSPGQYEIVLCEFKCPYSRIPSGGPPKYYIPQVKMGLDMLNLPTRGLFAEGVFRRCTWDQLDNTAACDKTLADCPYTNMPLALGIIGFYLNREATDAEHTQIIDNLNEAYTYIYLDRGGKNNDYHSNDLGDCPEPLFKRIIEAFSMGILTPYYLPVIPLSPHEAQNNDMGRACESSYCVALNLHLEQYTSFCRDNGYINYGLLPWKLFAVNYNYIDKEPNYLGPWMPKITEVIDFVKSCNVPEAQPIKLTMFNSFVRKFTGGGFSDD